MKLLFDHNLSLHARSHTYPISIRTPRMFISSGWIKLRIKLSGSTRLNDFIVVTKDADYSDLSVLSGYPPKVIWIRGGNCKTNEIASLLRSEYEAIEALHEDAATGILTLF